MVFYLFLKWTTQSMCYSCFTNEEIEILWFQKPSLGYIVNRIQIWKQIRLALNIHDIVSTMYIFYMHIVHISVMLLCKMVMADSKVKLYSIHSFWIHWILFSITLKSIPRHMSAPLAPCPSFFSYHGRHAGSQMHPFITLPALLNTAPSAREAVPSFCV